MPKAFTNCIKKGGKVRTVELGKNKYRYICILNGKPYAGEVHTKKSKKSNKK